MMKHFCRYFFWGSICFTIAHSGSMSSQTPPSSITVKKIKASPVDIGLGNPNAPLTIVMYHALNCLHCKEFKVDKLPAFKTKYIDTGKVYLILRDFPIDRDSMTAAKLAWCQRNPQNYKKIEEILTKNFKSDEQMTVEVDWVNAPDPTHALITLLGSHGMDAAMCQSCLTRTDTEDMILQNALEAKETYNLDYAPGFLLNGQMVDMNAINDLVENELEKIQK